MAGDVMIENPSTGSVLTIPGSAPATFELVREPINPDIPEAIVEPNTSLAPEEQAALDQARAERIIANASQRATDRAGHLRGVAGHVTEVRRLQGDKSYDGISDSEYEELCERQKTAESAASVALERACVLCDFKEDCELRGDIERWTDTHPYEEGHAGERRPGSSSVEAVESRAVFLRGLATGVKAVEQIHCDPARRQD